MSLEKEEKGRPKLYDVVTGRKPVQSYGLDPIEEELATEDQDLAREAKRLRLQEIVERRRRKVQELQGQPVAQASKTGSEFLKGIMQMAQVSPERAKQFLDSLGQDDVIKLSLLSASGEGNNSLQSILPFLKGGNNNISIKDIVDIVKMMQPPANQTSSKDLIEAFKTGIELSSKSHQNTQDPITSLKAYHEIFLKPVLDQLGSKDKEMMQMRMTQIENKLTSQVSPQDYIKTIKQTSQELGLSSQGKSEIDLKIEDMREHHDVDMARFGLEKSKWEWEKANSGKTIEQVKDLVKTVTEGPVGEVIKSFGQAGADKLRGGGVKSNPSNVVQVKCPSCAGIFPANNQLETVSCPLCGVTLSKGSPPAQLAPVTQAPIESQSSQTQQSGEPKVEQGQPTS